VWSNTSLHTHPPVVKGDTTMVGTRKPSPTGPGMSASTEVPPAGTWMLGEIFQPRPRPAAAAPVPSVARPPPPGAPVGFSALTDLLRACERRAMSRDRSGSRGGPVGGGHGVLGVLGVLRLRALVIGTVVSCRVGRPSARRCGTGE